MFKLILCLILISAIPSSFSKESETCSSSAVTDMNHTEIDVDSYCKDNPCLVKCCGQNEVLLCCDSNRETRCKNIDDLKNLLGVNRNITDFSSVPFDYSDIPFYDNNIYKNIEVTAKKFSDFTWLQRSMFKHPPGGRLCAVVVDANDVKLLEKGTLVFHKPNQYEYWEPKKTADFCVDMFVGTYNNQLIHDTVYMIKIPDIGKRSDKNFYTAICLTISAFFLLLVLVVYSLLHQLRNIQGMLLCAYVATLFAFYAIKAIYLFQAMSGINEQTVITQVQYFLILASFFWLKLMSFDIWWTFRGTRKHRDIHRRGINVKFLIYASYAFGVPAAMTIFASIMDEKELPEHIVKPFFRDGFLSQSMLFYLYIPLIILTTLNCLLFIMTVYNIWMIRRNLANFDKTTVKKNKSNQNRFMIYIKLLSIMGVSWILELVQNAVDPDNVEVWLDMVINGYNLLIGVIIFFLFIFKKNIFLMLCKRFNIENRWTRRAHAKNSTRSTQLDKISKNDSSKNSRSYDRTRSTEMDSVEDGLDDENIDMNEKISTHHLGSKKNTTLGKI